MSSILSAAIKAVKFIQTPPKRKVNIADELLGKYKGIIPKRKTSTEFIQELRGNLYGKIK